MAERQQKYKKYKNRARNGNPCHQHLVARTGQPQHGSWCHQLTRGYVQSQDTARMDSRAVERRARLLSSAQYLPAWPPSCLCWWPVVKRVEVCALPICLTVNRLFLLGTRRQLGQKSLCLGVPLPSARAARGHPLPWQRGWAGQQRPPPKQEKPQQNHCGLRRPRAAL